MTSQSELAQQAKKYGETSVTVIHSDILFLLLSGNTLFITDKMIEVCDSEDKLALVLSHELAHAILGHQTHRLMQWAFTSFSKKVFFLRESAVNEPKAVMLTAGQGVGGSVKREFFERRGGWLH